MDVVTVREAILAILERKLRRAGIEAAALDDDLDLLEAGVLDSFAFLQFLQQLGDRTGLSLDLGDTDPSTLTTIGGLLAYAEHQAA